MVHSHQSFQLAHQLHYWNSWPPNNYCNWSGKNTDLLLAKCLLPQWNQEPLIQLYKAPRKVFGAGLKIASIFTQILHETGECSPCIVQQHKHAACWDVTLKVTVLKFLIFWAQSPLQSISIDFGSSLQSSKVHNEIVDCKQSFWLAARWKAANQMLTLQTGLWISLRTFELCNELPKFGMKFRTFQWKVSWNQL